MLEEEKKAIDFFKTQLKNTQTNYTSMYYYVNNLELVLNLIEKQEKIIKDQSYTNKKIRKTLKTVRKERNKQNKIIDKMAEDVVLLKESGWLTNINNKQDAIKYYTKLVKEE